MKELSPLGLAALVTVLACGGRTSDGPATDAAADVTDVPADTLPVHTIVGTLHAAEGADCLAMMPGPAGGWPKPTTCPAVCPRCSGAVGVCVIDCGPADCAGKPIVCPDNMPCTVFCNPGVGCTNNEIRCPPNLPCDVICTSRSSCEGTRVKCGAGKCRICPGDSMLESIDCSSACGCTLGMPGKCE